MEPRVLVGAIISERHKYCTKPFICSLKYLTYPNFDLLFVDNSKDENFVNEFKEILDKESVKYLDVIKGEYYDKTRRSMVEARNKLRDHFLKNNYDYFFCVEQDTLLREDSIEALLKHNKDVAAGVLFGLALAGRNVVLRPAVYKYIEKEKFDEIMGNDKYRDLPIRKSIEANNIKNYKEVSQQLTMQEVAEPKLIEAKQVGLCCVLIKREVLEKIKFRYEEDKPVFDDTWFFIDIAKNRYKLYVDTGLKCEHLFVTRPWHWTDLVKEGKF